MGAKQKGQNQNLTSRTTITVVWTIIEVMYETQRPFSRRADVRVHPCRFAVDPVDSGMKRDKLHDYAFVGIMVVAFVAVVIGMTMVLGWMARL